MSNGETIDMRDTNSHHDKMCLILCLVIILLREHGVNCSQRYPLGIRLLRSQYSMAPFSLSFNICSIHRPKKL